MSDESVLYEAVLFAIASCPRAHDHRLRLTLADPDELKLLRKETTGYRSGEVNIVLEHLSCPVRATCRLLHEFGHFWSDKVYGNPVRKLQDWQVGTSAGSFKGTPEQRLEILEEEVRAWYLGTFVLYDVELVVPDGLFERCIQEYDHLSRESLRQCAEAFELDRDTFRNTESWPYLERWLRANLPKSEAGPVWSTRTSSDI
jgi:hypothetical protein